jgi:hypothetical protein
MGQVVAWLLGGLGCTGLPVAFALLVTHVLTENEYLLVVVASVTAYALALWTAERRDHSLMDR